jgi:tripartite-type tricarboxylate transporter receptor subunit TctC
MGASGTPAEVVEKVAKDTARALGTSDLRDSLAKDGADPMSMTQPEFARFVLSEAESANRIVEATGVNLNKHEIPHAYVLD